MSKLIAAAALSLGLAASPAFAHSNEARFEEQNDVIEQGRHDGSITWREGLKLRKEQAAIARTRAQLLADGRLSKKDRRTLHALQDKSQAHIIDEGTDSWRRLWWLPRVGK